MTCQEVEQLLLDDLSAAGRAAVREHLAACPACDTLHRELQALQDLSVRLRKEVSEGELPEEFTSKVISRIEAESHELAEWRLATVAAIVLLMSGTLIWTAAGGAGTMQQEASAGLSENSIDLEADDPPVQLILEAPADSEYILEVPSRIKIRRQELHDDFYLTQVSH